MAPQCDQLGIPKYLHKNGRSENNSFTKEEKLYRRIPPDAIHSNGEISPACLSLYDMSLNRERYSKSPEDVLYNIENGEHFLSSEILEIGVGSIELPRYPHPNDENRVYTFKMKHEPEECMYPHSVLKIILNHNEIKSKKDIPPTLRALFREHLRKKGTVVVRKS